MTTTENIIREKISIIIDILRLILGCSYSDAYNIVINSKMYYYLKQQDYGTLYDSPQANLSTIGAELREKNIDIGYKITDKAIKQAMLVMMQRNM